MTSISEKRLFSPLSISGCQLWLDAADSSTVTGTSSVTAWTDKSGLGNSPSFGANKPSYAGSFIETSNSNVDFTIPISTISTTPGQGGVLFFVFADKQDNPNYPALFSSGDPYRRFYQILLYSYGYEVASIKMTQTGLDAMNTTNFILYSFSYITGSSVSVRVNGTEIVSSPTVSPNPSGQIYIGKDGWGDGTGNLKLKEILFFNTIFSDNQRQEVEGYLAWKWGLQRSLPGSHPNYLVNGSSPFPSFAIPTTPFKTRIISALFSPLSIAGCALWLDGSDTTSLTISSGAITQWRDKSGSSNHFAQTSGTPSSISDNGRSVVNFTSGAIMTSANQITFTGSSAFFIVSRLNLINASNAGMLLGFTNINGADFSIRFYGPYGPNLVLAGTDGTGTNGYDLGNNNYYVNGTFNPSFRGSTYSNVYSLIATVAPPVSGTSFLTLSSSFMSRFFIGYVAEFLYYPGGLTSRQRQQVEGYLAWKWGIQSSLPGSHPNFSVNEISAPFPSFAIPTTPFKIKFQRNSPISFMYDSGYTWYDTRNMTTTVFTDRGPNAYNGSMSSLLSTTSGPYSDMTGLIFTSSQTVSCPTGYATNNFTISYWIYFINKAFLGGIGYQYILTGGRLQVHQYVNNSSIYFDSGGNEFVTVTNPGANWTHFIFVYNTTGGTITVYQNGILSKLSVVGVNGAGGFVIGKTGDYHFQSYISDVRLVPILLTADQANAFYRSYASGIWKVGY
jgi:hypothetical protein